MRRGRPARHLCVVRGAGLWYLYAGSARLRYQPGAWEVQWEVVMRRVVLSLLSIAVTAALTAGGCGRGPAEVASFPVDGDQDIVDRGGENVAFDREESADGGGSLRAESERPRTVRLYEIRNPRGLEGRLIVLTAQVKSVGVHGRVFPELWINAAGRNEVQARNPAGVIGKTRNWTPVRIEYRCEQGERPDLLRVNLVIDGFGRAWIDDIRITSEPLPPLAKAPSP